MSERRPSQDESRRDLERALRSASPGPDRAIARLAVVAAERRRGRLDLAALALEEAIREGGPLELAGAELAALLAQDPRAPGARRALACFAAVPVPVSDPFPDIRHAGLRAIQRATLFRATFRSIPREAVLALEPAVLALAPGRTGSFGREKWSASLGRSVDDAEARALDAVYGRLLGASRRRVVARLDTPGPLHEVASERLPLDGDRFQLAFGDELRTWILGERGGRHLLVESQSGVVVRESEVLAGVQATPVLVPTGRGAFVAAVDDGGDLHASFTSPFYSEPPSTKKRVGAGASIGAACTHALGLAVFLAPGARALTITEDGRVSRARFHGHEIVSAASHGGEIVVLSRSSGRSELLHLDSQLRVQGEPVPLPALSADARLACAADDVVILDPPGVAHFVRGGRLNWTARIPEPLDGLELAAPDGLELVAYGRIESEWGQGEADVGIARWTRDGLGRHGPTVRVEVAPSGPIPLVRLACRGDLLAVAYRGLQRVTVRFASLAPIEAQSPSPAEWTFAGDDAPDSLPSP